MSGPYDRPLIGEREFRYQVRICGRTDEAWLLADIVGWMLGCPIEHELAAEVGDLKARGWRRPDTAVCTIKLCAGIGGMPLGWTGSSGRTLGVQPFMSL